MKATTRNKIERNVTRKEISKRGGGIEIALDEYGFRGQRMSAYQNYLGGGILGRIQNDCTIRDFRDSVQLSNLAKRLAEYYYEEIYELFYDDDIMDFDSMQKLPASAY